MQSYLLFPTLNQCLSGNETINLQGTEKNTGGKKARGRASKLPPACFAASSKLAAPAAGSLEVDNTPPHDQWEEEDDTNFSILYDLTGSNPNMPQITISNLKNY